MRETFGIKGNSNGFSIDYAKLVNGLGPEQCQELKAAIDNVAI